MSFEHERNRKYLLRLWLPALAVCAFVGILIVAALASGDAARVLPATFGIAFAALMFFVLRGNQERKIERMLQAADPTSHLRSFAASLRRMSYGSHFAAAITATVLALFGRFAEAEQSVNSVLWDAVPPLIQAQGSAARAVLAYARGAVAEGMDHAVAATQQSSVSNTAPGARTSELAFRTYRNLGLALSGRATTATAEELREAFTQSPLLVQVLAAWGLAKIEQDNAPDSELQKMRAFLQAKAPHCMPVFESTGAPADTDE